MKPTLLRCLPLALAFSYPAYADIQFSGFGTLSAGVLTDSNTEVRDYTDTDFDFSEGSFFALQAYSDLGDGLSATAQIRARGSEEWDPEFTWAYVSYQVKDNWRVQAGRQRIPLYLYSDYLDVSYAYHWIAPPAEVYQSFFDSIDGISSIHDFSIGDSQVNLRVYYGQEETIDEDVQFNVDKVFSVVASVNYDWWTFRTSYVTFDLDADVGLQPLANAWRQTPFGYIGSDLEIQDDKLTGMEFGMIYDNQDWLFVAEYISTNFDHTFVGDVDPWMVSLGKRFGSIMVHGTVGKDSRETAVDLSAVPTGISTELDQLYSSTEQLLASVTRESPFYTIGVRWDFHDSAALKTEYTNYEQVDGSDSGLVQVALVTVF